ADAADARGVVTVAGERANDIRLLEYPRAFVYRRAARKAGREQASMRPRRRRCRQKTCKEGVVSRVCEARRRMPPFPTVGRQEPGQCGCTSGRVQLGGHVVPERVEGDEEYVVAAHDRVHVHARAAIWAAYVSRPSTTSPGRRSPKALTSA